MSETEYFCQIPPFGIYIMSTSGKYGPLGVEQDGAYYYLLGLSSTTLFIVLFKYFSVIIKKVEMLFVVLNTTAC